MSFAEALAIYRASAPDGPLPAKSWSRQVEGLFILRALGGNIGSVDVATKQLLYARPVSGSSAPALV